ncbi:molybdate ABC transporter substrate-binding protein [Bradyrhizobium sp. AUGA SZCCT0176]|uniref:molybdate ABC transporter substrate-binding protein n=1 Tax=Bradyrhizobium sp. AUGA SZCCT0176 TaxID=2807664 RepID=UPI001BA9EA49|nr:molybdate ABC transporter substrate-binding protein [Bradyrhizobium sp. AUGA SZCCT0176]MBR1225212.1 molybdate ABC transporter substrate-binding protein [Bradyrhizobium sp. AUGA SZCCT0176]
MKYRLPRLAAFALATVLSLAHASAQNAPAIAAASDLKFALDAVAAQFKSDTGKDLKVTYGSSGNFARQLEQDAPFEMFLSADEGFVFKLADSGKTLDRGALYAEGRIVLFAPTGSSLKPDADFSDLKAALADGRIQKFAIANPEHAPYGVAAQQALESKGLWDTVKPKMVLGENVSQAAQFATSGSAQGGIFAYSLALSPEVSKLGTYTLVPAAWHKPLRQRMVLMKNAGDTVKPFYEYMQSPPARAVLRKFGFGLPGEVS